MADSAVVQLGGGSLLPVHFPAMDEAACGAWRSDSLWLLEGLRFWFRCTQWWRTMVAALLAVFWCRFRRQGCVEVVHCGEDGGGAAADWNQVSKCGKKKTELWCCDYRQGWSSVQWRLVCKPAGTMMVMEMQWWPARSMVDGGPTTETWWLKLGLGFHVWDGGDDDVAVYDWPDLKVGDCHMAWSEWVGFKW